MITAIAILYFKGFLLQQLKKKKKQNFDVKLCFVYPNESCQRGEDLTQFDGEHKYLGNLLWLYL